MSRSPLQIGRLRGQRDKVLRSGLARRRRRPRSRWRVAAVWFSGVAVVALALVAVRWLTVTDTFNVRHVRSGPYRYTEEAQLEEVFTALLGRNIWTLPTADVRQQLVDLPWVREAALARHLPDGVAVTLAEWRPLAAVATDAAEPSAAPELVLRRDGRVCGFPSHLVGPEMPLIVGLELAAQPDSGLFRLVSPTSDDVLAVLDAITATGLEAHRTVDFVVAGAGGFTIVLQEERIRLLVGKEDFAARIDRYLVAKERVPAGSEVDLRFQDRVTYRQVALH